MRVEAGDELIVGRRQLLLRLHHFHVVGHAGAEAVLRLLQRLPRIIESGLGDVDLFRGGFEIQQRVLNVLLDTSSQVVYLRLPLLEDGIGLLHVCLDFAALKDWDLQRARPRPVWRHRVRRGA